MRLLIAAVALVIPTLSCAEPTPSQPVAPVTVLANAASAAAAPDDPFLVWTSLVLTGDTYEAKLAALPDDPTRRRAMARYLLDVGGFECGAFEEHDECGTTVREWRELEPGADFFDPCLRRRLALWSLAQLDVADAAGLREALAELVVLPAPETELQDAALTLAAGDDALLMSLLQLAEPELAERHAVELASDEARLFALRELHLNSVVETLDVERHRGALVAAMVDEMLEVETRSALVDRFAEDPGADVAAALAEVADDADCGLAMHAAMTLDERGDASHLPRRPRSTDPEVHLAAMCMQVQDELAPLAAWLPRAMKRVDSSEEWLEDGEREVTEDVTRIDARDAEAAFHDVVDALGAGGASCTGLTCSLSSPSSDVTITFARSGGSLVVTEIAEHHYSGCGC